jgi:hypothetical protein
MDVKITRGDILWTLLPALVYDGHLTCVSAPTSPSVSLARLPSLSSIAPPFPQLPPHLVMVFQFRLSDSDWPLSSEDLVPQSSGAANEYRLD